MPVGFPVKSLSAAELPAAVRLSAMCLGGTVRRWGNRARVNVPLIDAETNANIWAERFDTTQPSCSRCKRRPALCHHRQPKGGSALHCGKNPRSRRNGLSTSALAGSAYPSMSSRGRLDSWETASQREVKFPSRSVGRDSGACPGKAARSAPLARLAKAKLRDCPGSPPVPKYTEIEQPR